MRDYVCRHFHRFCEPNPLSYAHDASSATA
jgi:hypothetical protein